MEIQQFKTNIKCGGCIATVTPFLNTTAGEHTWKVDVAAPDKILTVSSDKASAEEIIAAVKKAGYEAVKL